MVNDFINSSMQRARLKTTEKSSQDIYTRERRQIAEQTTMDNFFSFLFRIAAFSSSFSFSLSRFFFWFKMIENSIIKNQHPRHTHTEKVWVVLNCISVICIGLFFFYFPSFIFIRFKTIHFLMILIFEPLCVVYVECSVGLTFN